MSAGPAVCLETTSLQALIKSDGSAAFHKELQAMVESAASAAPNGLKMGQYNWKLINKGSKT